MKNAWHRGRAPCVSAVHGVNTHLECVPDAELWGDGITQNKTVLRWQVCAEPQRGYEAELFLFILFTNAEMRSKVTFPHQAIAVNGGMKTRLSGPLGTRVPPDGPPTQPELPTSWRKIGAAAAQSEVKLRTHFSPDFS